MTCSRRSTRPRGLSPQTVGRVVPLSGRHHRCPVSSSVAWSASPPRGARSRRSRWCWSSGCALVPCLRNSVQARHSWRFRVSGPGNRASLHSPPCVAYVRSAASLAGYPPNANRPRLRRMVKATLKTTLTTIQNRHPPGTRTKPKNRLSSPGALALPPAPLVVFAPNERYGEDQYPSKQPAHLFLLLPSRIRKGRGY
jgi:hypothetical protein